MEHRKAPSYLNFDKKNYPWKPDTDYRKQPQLYRVGKGEQGVLICEPYKSEIGQFWRFRTPEIAIESSEMIYKMFLGYIQENDFVGGDMARKYLQMGYTRARRYANYRGGRKYQKQKNYQLNERGTGDPEKAKSAEIFYQKYKLAAAHAIYKHLKADWQKRYG